MGEVLTDEPYVDARAIAKKLGVHRRTVQRWAQSGRVPYYKCAGTLRFKLSEVVTAMKSAPAPAPVVPQPRQAEPEPVPVVTERIGAVDWSTR